MNISDDVLNPAYPYELEQVEQYLLKEDETSLSDKELATRLGPDFSERRVRVIRRGGRFRGIDYPGDGLMDQFTADEIACQGLHLHPYQIWGGTWLKEGLVQGYPYEDAA